MRHRTAIDPPSPRDDISGRVVLTLEPAGTGGAPFAVRLRKVLKNMLRQHGVRCVAISPEHPETPRTTPWQPSHR
jgi:hypothetical protein